MKTATKAAVIAALAFIFPTPYALPAEPSMTQDIVIMPYPVTTGRNSAKEFATPPSVVSKEQKIRDELAIITSFAFIDYNQSVAMFHKMDGYREINPVLGSKPSRGDMVAFGVIGIGLFSILANTLSDPLRQIVVDSIIASERMNIEENRRVFPGWNAGGPPLRGRFMNGIPIVISFRF